MGEKACRQDVAESRRVLFCSSESGSSPPSRRRTDGASPGADEVRAHCIEVVMDIVRRYDVDGIHFDDYFYPYPSYDDGAPFPDSASWARARENGWTGSRDDWRRHNVNELVERLYRSIKETKPHVQFGISPFGIWRPDHPPGTQGFDAYAELYADARKWIRNGWVDYLTPQLYYRLDQFGYSYPEMLRWWIEQNEQNRHVWPGLYTSRVGMEGERHWSDRQILGQIYTARSHPGANGQVHFSMKALLPLPDSVQVAGRPDTTIIAPVPDTLTADSVHVAGRTTDSVTVDSTTVDSVTVAQTGSPPRALQATHRLRTRLRTEAYATPALVPPSPWLDGKTPERPTIAIDRGEPPFRLTLSPNGNVPTRWWTIRWYSDDQWHLDIVPGETRIHTLPSSATDSEIVLVSAVGRSGQIGPPAVHTPQ
jgi:hypothetical protein